MLAAFAAGLADAHAGSVAAASLAARGDITVGTALVAIAASTRLQPAGQDRAGFTAGGRRFGMSFAAGMAPPAIVFGVALAFVVGFDDAA